MNFCGESLIPFMNTEKGTGEKDEVVLSRIDCFIALMAIFCRRSIFRFCLSLLAQCKKEISSTPISTHFSTIHSILSGLLVGAMAI